MITLRNRWWEGLGLGLLFPFVGYALILVITERLDLWLQSQQQLGGSLLDQETQLLLALCANLLPFHWLDRQRYRQAMQGLVGTTLVLAGIWVTMFLLAPK